MGLDLYAALVEIREKSVAQIEKDTAYKWASRAIVCYKLFVSTGEQSWLPVAENYEHEALEHAALVRDRGETLKAVEDEIDMWKSKY